MQTRLIFLSLMLLASACASVPEPEPREVLYRLEHGQEPPPWSLCVVSDAGTTCGYLSPVKCVLVAERVEGECIRKRP